MRTRREPLRWLIVAAAILITAALAIGLGVGVIGRRLAEFDYVKYVQGEYLPRQVEKEGRWPASLRGVEQDLQDESKPVRHRMYIAHGLLAIHRSASPELAVNHVDANTLKGRLTFRWLFGGSYDFEARKRGRPTGDPGSF